MRRALRQALAVLAATLVASAARADELPVALQVQLLSKMTTYIDKFSAGEGGVVKVVVLHPGTTPTRGAQALVTAIGQVGQFGALKAEAKLLALGDVKKLQGALAAEKPQVIYLAPELDEKGAQSVVEAASTSPVVTITGVADQVKLGVVLGFALVEARPRVLVNLKQANKQGIAFRNGLLAHSVIVDR